MGRALLRPMRGFLRLLNYEVARELLEAAQPPT
jgi:hypothetical protein